jgi:hypothetical protein
VRKGDQRKGFELRGLKMAEREEKVVDGAGRGANKRGWGERRRVRERRWVREEVGERGGG